MNCTNNNNNNNNNNSRKTNTNTVQTHIHSKTMKALTATTKETLQFRVSFNPTSNTNCVVIELPNGKIFTSKKKEVMKHVTRAVLKACLENNLPKKAASLRPFMKDETPPSLKHDKIREAFLGIPAAKRAKVIDENGVKRGDWSNEEDEAILDHAAKFVEGEVDWSVFTLPDRVWSQNRNRYKVLSRKKGDWTKEEDDAIMKHAQEVGDTDWSSFVLPRRIARQYINRYKRLSSGKNGAKRGGWTKEEDDVIMKHGQEVGDMNWSALLPLVPDRGAKQCSHRYNRLISKITGPIKRGDRTAKEDEQILDHGTNVGDKGWPYFAQTLPGRITNQCKHRYKRLSSADKRDCSKEAWTKKKDGKKVAKWTADEDQIIKDHVQKYGEDKWKLVAKQLSGRVGGGCKQRWFKHLSKACEEDDRV